MTKLSDELLKKYLENPLQMDEKVREYCKLSESKYYTVSVWPDAGYVNQTNATRVVKAKKVSKSDQQ
jgi:hypothetical protein